MATNIITRIKDIARTAIPSDGRAILFGSRARGDASKESDWDILILLNKDRLEQSDYEQRELSICIVGLRS